MTKGRRGTLKKMNAKKQIGLCDNCDRLVCGFPLTICYNLDKAIVLEKNFKKIQDKQLRVKAAYRVSVWWGMNQTIYS